MWKPARRLLLPVAAALLLAGCDKVEQGGQTLPSPYYTPHDVQYFPPGPAEPPISAPPPSAATGGDTIKVASFNIQVFGMSKLGKPEVMDVLAKVVRRFDVVAIQKVHSKDTTLLPRFVEMINAEGAQYDYLIGPRLGHTVSKEQYAFVFDTTPIEYDLQSIYTAEDPEDLLHREPFITRFMVRGPQPAGRSHSRS